MSFQTLIKDPKNSFRTLHFVPHIYGVLSNIGQVDVTYWFEGLCVKRVWDDNFARYLYWRSLTKGCCVRVV